MHPTKDRMSYAAPLLRLAITFVAGRVFYMIAAVLDVLAPVGGVEAFIRLFVQAVMGALFTGVAIALVGVFSRCRTLGTPNVRYARGRSGNRMRTDDRLRTAR